MTRKITIICLLLLSSITMTSQTKSAAYLSNTSQPWGQNSNIMALNAVYDTDWTQYFYNSAVIAEIFVADRAFVWIEGGNSDTSLMLNVINSNKALIESWVSNGGILLISAATNEFSTPYSVGFGITSQQVYTTKVVAADVNHPFFTNSTYTPILAPLYTGSYIAHNVHTGAGLTPILSSSAGTGDVFAEKPFGSGLVLFSGLTTPFFLTSSDWQPQPQMTNMLYAMIDYARNAGMTAVTNVTQTVGEFGYTFSVSGTTSYILVPSGATPPTAAQVAAGINYANVTILDAQTVSTTGGVPNTFNLSNLIADTNYDIYVVTFYLERGTNIYSDVGKTSFTTEPNDLPVSSAIANQSECVNGSLNDISLTITDAYPGDNTYTVTGSSSNTSLVPNGNIIITGSGTSRSIAITPNTGISGTSTITISMTDSLGATGVQTFTVTFNDTVLPTITAPTDISTTTNTGCTATGVVLGTPTTADNCGVVSATNNAPTAFPKGTTTVTWTVTDLGGNTKTATQTVTVTDNVNPTITAPATVNTTTNTACTATGLALGTPTTSDNCSVASVTNNAPTVFPLGSTTVTWTVTDGSGRTATATQTVNVTDNVNPTITAPAAVNTTTNTACTATGVVLGIPTNADNCSVASVTNNAPTAFPLGVTTVTWTVTDSAGNTATATQTVMVTDNINPTITAPATVNTTSNTACTATGVALGTPVTADNCSVASVTNNAPSSFPLGNTTVIWTVTDGAGRTATATQTVNITDNINPTITAPADVVGNVNGSCVASAIALGTPVTADNCSVASVTNDAPTNFPLGDTTVTWTVIDGSGNTATTTQLVSVGDTVYPVVKTKNATVYLNNLGQAIVTPAMIDNGTTDNCDFSLIISPNNFVCGNVGINNVILIATDASGNQTIRPAIVTIVDNLPPSITAPSAVSPIANASCGATGVALGTPITADNCFIDTPAVNNAPSTFPLGVTTVTWTVIDRSGNSNTATQIITVLDTQNPTIATLAATSVNADAGVCTYASSQLTKPSAADNCSVIATVSPASLALGSNTVTWTATDGSGNTATSTQNVTVEDIQMPTIVVSTVLVSANASCSATGIDLGTPTTTDNCSVALVTNDAPAIFELGNTTVIWTVTDGSGNTATANQTVTVVDQQNPTVETLADISLNADAGICSYASSQLTAPTAADNCSVSNVVVSPASLALGYNLVTWTVTDGSGNIATSTQNVTVIDAQKPTIATLDAISVNADSGVCTYESLQLTAPKAIDNCSVARVVVSPASLILGSNTVTWTATDGSGLTETSIQIVTVVDSQNPTIATLDAISVNADSGICTYASSQLTAPTAADNCRVTSVLASPSSLELGANTVTWTVTDGSGLTATSTQTITVVDIQKPIIAVLDVVVSANASCIATGVDLGIPTTTDNCSVSSVTSDAPTTFPLGDTTVTWTVTDGSGNTATTTQLVTVKDTTSPTITAPAAVNGNVNASCGATGVAIGNAITTDNCSVVSVTHDAPAIFPLGETTVTWTVTDGSGNTATATQLVTMGDTILPVVKAKNATVYINSLGQAIILPSMIDNGTTDNCAFTLTVSPNNLVCANVGQNNVLLIATDASGNQSFKPATITLVDNLAPVIVAPLSVSANANTACSATGIILGTPVTTDNCTVDTVTNNAPATFQMGVTTVTWTATDRSGNSATATQTVTVTDSVLPTVKTKDITIVLDASGNATLTAAEIDNGSSDNCGISTMTLSQDTFTISDIGIKTITLTVTDNSGNTSSATAQVTVDGTLGTINLKSNLFVIYPIPFDSYINITLPDSYTDDVIYIQIYDLTGRVVYNQKHVVDNHNLTISDLNQYSDGSYYIHLLDGNQTVIQSNHILKKAKQ